MQGKSQDLSYNYSIANRYVIVSESSVNWNLGPLRVVRPVIALDTSVTTDQVEILDTPPSEDWISPINEP